MDKKASKLHTILQTYIHLSYVKLHEERIKLTDSIAVIMADMELYDKGESIRDAEWYRKATYAKSLLTEQLKYLNQIIQERYDERYRVYKTMHHILKEHYPEIHAEIVQKTQEKLTSQGLELDQEMSYLRE